VKVAGIKMANESSITISKQEAWKVLDALEAYKKDYSVNAAANKVIESVSKKLKNFVHNDK
jgi:sulfur relay (sulfurtransferase) DsrC/TusE family protein